MTSRDPKSGRFARRPVPDFDAESEFDPMGDSIEDITNVSGAPSPSTIAYRRVAPAGDELAQGGQRSPLRGRNPTLVHADDEGFHNGILRTAARRSAALRGTVGRPHGVPGRLDVAWHAGQWIKAGER